MNLHQIISGNITVVNPFLGVTVQSSAGYTTAPDGKQIPAYDPPVDDVPAQIQALTYRDLVQIDGLNLNGTKRAIYLNGTMNGVVRVLAKGGDLITVPAGTLPQFSDDTVWLVALVLEQWDSWVKVAVVLQDGS